MATKQGTSIFHINDLRSWSVSTEVGKDGDKKWVHARPLGLRDLRSRLSIALKVLKGEADAVIWEQQ